MTFLNEENLLKVKRLQNVNKNQCNVRISIIKQSDITIS